MAGTGVIVAHAERYEALRKDIETVRHLKAMGAYIQVNASSLEKSRLHPVGKVMTKWLEEDLIDVVGTDAHRDKVRPPKIRKAMKKVEKSFGKECVEDIFRDRAREILLS